MRLALRRTGKGPREFYHKHFPFSQYEDILIPQAKIFKDGVGAYLRFNQCLLCVWQVVVISLVDADAHQRFLTVAERAACARSKFSTGLQRALCSHRTVVFIR
jgi:hypothetical protein